MRVPAGQLSIAFGFALLSIVAVFGLLGLGILYQSGDLSLEASWTAPPLTSPGIQLPLAPSASSDIAIGSEGWGQRWFLIFSTVFVAEMGDKTQLATLLMSAQSPSPWGIFIGSAGALVVASLISVLLGEGLAQVIPRDWLQLIAGIGFVVIGAYVLWNAWQEQPEADL
ncbi:MAG: TMEM165/GDT1 family protein [Synechococcaceae cyanobacterium SM2_3_2]|nr:TMEM165/GDT1 family protein [Synechococcaceae cyanobacterium SM2_3_2]